jgi:hypothetical protein
MSKKTSRSNMSEQNDSHNRSRTMASWALEVETDARGRVSLGKISKPGTRYRVVETEDCELVLTPVVSVSARELALLQNPEAAKKLRHSIAQAEAGEMKSYQPGHFSELSAQYGDDEE